MPATTDVGPVTTVSDADPSPKSTPSPQARRAQARYLTRPVAVLIVAALTVGVAYSISVGWFLGHPLRLVQHVSLSLGNSLIFDTNIALVAAQTAVLTAVPART